MFKNLFQKEKSKLDDEKVRKIKKIRGQIQAGEQERKSELRNILNRSQIRKYSNTENKSIESVVHM